MIALTGATGQLGHYVLQDLLNTVPASQIVAIVRNPAKAQALSQQGVVVRQADYSDEAALTAALQGVDKLLLISSSEVGQRAVQHRNVINAAKAAGVKFIAYTSLLHADTSPLGLAAEHIETEQMLADSGIAYALLRNGWYTENYLASAPPALEHGVFIGAAGEGKIASATRADYATAAARVITSEGHEGKISEPITPATFGPIACISRKFCASDSSPTLFDTRAAIGTADTPAEPISGLILL